MSDEFNVAARMPSHSGVTFRELFMFPLGITCIEAANEMSMELDYLAEVISGRREVTQETAIKFAEYSNTSAKSWRYMQVKLDEWVKSNERVKSMVGAK